MGFGKDGKGAMIRENNSLSIGTLAAADLISMASIAVTEDFRILKTEVMAHVEGLTAGEGIGLILGIADAELTDAEIEEALEVNGPLDRNDRLNFERVTRPVWPIAALEIVDSGGLAQRFIGLNGGPTIEWKKRWTFSSPEGFEFWLYNDAGTPLTTGATLKVLATHYGVWVT